MSAIMRLSAGIKIRKRPTWIRSELRQRRLWSVVEGKPCNLTTSFCCCCCWRCW